MDDSSSPTPELPERKNRFSSSSGIKRNKVSRACDECRKRKVRCDGAQPCARCQKSSTECIFSNVAPKRGPPKQYLEPFETRLKSIDVVLQVLESTTQTDYTKLIDDNYATWQRQNPPIETNTQLDISSIGHALYVPDFPARLDRIESLLYKNNLLNIVQTTEQVAPSAIYKITETKANLIQLYFQYVHPFIPFLHRSILSTQQKDTQPSLLLLNAIYAVSSKYVKYDQKTKLEEEEEEEERDPPGWSYYKTALNLIDTYADRPRLSTIQALLLLAKYNEHVYRTGFFWRTKHVIQLAVKMSTDMGLSKEEGASINCCHSDLELKRRTFWAVYAYEVLMSTEQGAQMCLNHRECTVRYPHVLSDESSSDPSAIVNFYWMAKVIHTQAAVLEFMRTKHGGGGADVVNFNTTTNEHDEFLMLEQGLSNLGKSIPPLTEEKGIMKISFVHLIYHTTTILLYRPYALSMDNQAKYISPCLAAAAKITHIVDYRLKLEGMDAFYGMLRGHQQIIYCLTAALTIQRAFHHLSDQSVEMYQKTCSLLQKFIKKSPAIHELESNKVAEAPPPADVNYQQQLQVLVENRPELQFVSPSNTSSTRSSPLIPALGSPHSPSLPAPTIRKRHSRSSLQFTTSDNMNYMMQSSSSHVPEHLVHPRMRPTAVNRVPYANNRLSAPALGSMYQQSPYFYQMQQIQQQQQHQQQQQIQHHHQQQMYSYSQPSSPTTGQFGSDYPNISNNSAAAANASISGFPNTPRRTTSMSRAKVLRRSASSTGEFIVPSQQQRRATPYINPRRHTLTNTTPPDLSFMIQGPSSTTSSTSSSASSIVPPSPRQQQHLHAMAASARHRGGQQQGQRFSAPVMMTTTYMIPITHQRQQQYQTNMMLDPSFPMDPVIPDSPNESMMGLLLNPWDFTNQHPPPPP